MVNRITVIFIALSVISLCSICYAVFNYLVALSSLIQVESQLVMDRPKNKIQCEMGKTANVLCK